MIMSDLQGQIWMDGSFCDWKKAKIHILTHTMHYGTGVFEGVRAYETEIGPAIFRLEDHTDRLFESANLVGMNIPFTKDQLMQAQCDSVIKNNLNKKIYYLMVSWFILTHIHGDLRLHLFIERLLNGLFQWKVIS